MSLLALSRVYRSGHAPVEALAACEAERDRLAAALKRIASRDLTLTGYTNGCNTAQAIAREALNPGDTTQEPA